MSDSRGTSGTSNAAGVRTDLESPESPELSTELRSLIMRLNRLLRNQRASDEITEGQLSALAYVVRNGPTAPNKLSRWEQVSPPSMNRTINSLEELGLICRSPDPHDGRMVVVSPTDSGRELVYETRRRRDAWLHTQLAALSDTERHTITEATTLLRAIIEQ